MPRKRTGVIDGLLRNLRLMREKTAANERVGELGARISGPSIHPSCTGQGQGSLIHYDNKHTFCC